jgi:hypothetical protein
MVFYVAKNVYGCKKTHFMLPGDLGDLETWRPAGLEAWSPVGLGGHAKWTCHQDDLINMQRYACPFPHITATYQDGTRTLLRPT